MLPHKLFRWRSSQAVSDTIGAATGVTTMLITVAGLIAVGQAWITQSVLQRVANQAAQSEARQGCWTNATSQAVAESLQTSSIAPGAVTVTRWAALGTAYGNPVNVTLAARFSVPLYGATTVTASAAMPSAYAASNGIPTCIGPTAPTLPPSSGASPSIPPLLNTVTPNPLTPGDSVTLTGVNLGAQDTSGDTLMFTDNGYSWGSSNTLVISSWSTTSITFLVPADAPPTNGAQYATIAVTVANSQGVPVSSAPMEVSVQ